MRNIYTQLSIIVLTFVAFQLSPNRSFAQSDSINLPFKGFGYFQPSIGGSQYFGDYNPDDLWNKNQKFSYGAVLGYQASPLIGFRTQFIKTKLSSERDDMNQKFSSDLWDAALHITVNINEIFAEYNEKRFLNFYFFTGAGLTSFKSKVEDMTTGAVIEEHTEWQKEFMLPVGGGASLRISPVLSVNLEYGDRVTFKGNTLDLVDNAKKNDHYSYYSAGLQINFKPKDTDRDGVKDKNDLCVETYGKVELAGCPDKDNDGIADKDDACPEVAGKPEFKGCPDTDGDGIPDPEDACPAVAGKKETKGCPDTDGDGVIDGEDLWPAVFGLAIFAGVPDTDGDGVPDNNDQCKDKKGPTQFMGCPDTDGDGIPDNKDNCPDVAGVAANNGCPAVIMGSVMEKTVYFDPDSWIALAKYIIEMNEIAAYMNEHPEAVISVAGHADSRESENYNISLSERRADYVIEYLKKKGMKSEKIDKAFFGESKPVADNNTAEGRALNRRVEIKITK
jgi:OmpA-OmpF porin, OOP family